MFFSRIIIVLIEVVISIIIVVVSKGHLIKSITAKWRNLENRPYNEPRQYGRNGGIWKTARTMSRDSTGETEQFEKVPVQ